MTVASSTSRAQYNCSGGTTYTFSFGVGETSEIKVILTDGLGIPATLTETTHYSVSATNNDFSSGGTVTTVAAYDTPYTITILRNVPITQSSDYVEGMESLYETFEDGLDKLTRIDQQQQEILNRALTIPEASSATTALSALVANGYLRANSTGTGFEFATLVETGAISDEAYNATTWAAADDTAPSKKAVRDKIEAIDDAINEAIVFATAAEIIAGTETSKIIAPDQLAASYKLLPAGVVLPYGKNTAPDGWLICNGAAYSRTTYANLFSVIGTTFGSGDGSTTFNVPNLLDRVPVGSGSSYSLAATGGEATHTLSLAEMYPHTHGITTTDNGGTPKNMVLGGTSGTNTGLSTGSAGSGSAHNNMQPYIALNYIIKY